MENKTIFPMNLQLFAEGEGTESTVNAEPVANVEPQQTTTNNTQNEQVTPTDSVKVDTANPQVEEKPVQTPEENSKFAQIRREYEAKISTEKAKAIDDYIASQGFEFDGKPIITKAEYDKAIEINNERQRQEQLKEQGIDPKIVEDYVNNNPTVKKAQELLTKQEQEAKQQQEFEDFWQANPNVKPEDIPAEVWQERNQHGTPLKVAYAMAENSKLKAKLEAYEQGLKTKEVNAKNAVNSTGSVTGNGTNGQAFYTREQVEAMSIKEINQHYKEVMSSQKQWK